MSRFIRPFDALANSDVALVGGKNASLGEMYRTLTPLGVRIPNGIAVTAEAYRYVLDRAGAWPALHAALDGIDPSNASDFAARAQRARQIVASVPIPEDLEGELRAAYRQLEAQYGAGVSVAVRSSATAEDLPTASFAGQHESYLNVRGADEVIAAYRRCLASLFLERAVHYRIDQGFDHFKVALSVGIMKMVRADLASSGVAFTLDTETGFRDVVFITAAYGLGENVVQGAVDPDEFYVHKPTFARGFRAVLRRRLGSKDKRMVFAENGGTRNVEVQPDAREVACISDDEVLTIADACVKIETHYGMPMDVEWAKDGDDGFIYVVQARPETAVSQRKNVVQEYAFSVKPPKPLVTGRSVGSRIGIGRAHVIHSLEELGALAPGEVLVSETTTPDWEPIMKTASGIVTDRGGRTCHAAIVARELGIPAVVGTGTGTAALAKAGDVTVSCAEGDDGKIYSGRIPFDVKEIDVATTARLPAKLMVILADPDTAFATSLLPNDGVALLRMEFIIADHIKVHPMALVHPERIKDPKVAASVMTLTRHYEKPVDYFIERLSEGVGTIAAAFYPKPVIVRMSDFKTNEYAALLGGADFEPVEDNPMLGFRGAARYAHPAYAEGFALECAAMKRVREVMGLDNVILMIPFCRRVNEAERVVDRMAELGLRRGEKGLKIYVMCEIPNNVVQIDAFSKHFDGFSIGSNDLTQLVLGVDRDSELVSFDFDERDAGVLEMLRAAIEGAKRNGRYIGICGQAPSDFPEIAKFLIDLKIDSIGLNPDSIMKTVRALAKNA